MRPTIYVAGPLGSETPRENMRRAIAVGEELYAAGFAPFVPHLWVVWHDEHPHSYGEWMELCLGWVERCDYLLRIPGESPGADREVAHALARGIDVFRSVDDAARSVFSDPDRQP